MFEVKMGEIDFQMALLLQHRFEQEHKIKTDSEKTDQQLAKELQQQFELEEATERPSNGLVYKQAKDTHNSSKCLTDPSWELVDPTPDIHNLFIAFNERFFWNKLLAVCVSWSKRMTSCAGICSYNGRGGMCSITLSEPLLKLRPRKDLVETLLHEMIHAYLFVTHNNRDRDGHGPEFHKHMFRINKESGTNITVYHSFHDEVRLYQQHWWRCDGPCQHRKPYFGMVRRASNRAPGPNDRWWAEHSQTCGGTFIKVREPERTKKGKNVEKKIVNNMKKDNKDIRDFMKTSGKPTTSSNIKGFKDLPLGITGGKSNSSSTIVVTKNSSTNNQSSFTPTVFNAGTSTVPVKKINNAKTESDYSSDYLSVRNHWANKFNTNKRPAIEAPTSSSKVAKVLPPSEELKDNSQSVSDFIISDEYCHCPVCDKRLGIKDLDNHLDVCLSEPVPRVNQEEDKQECPVCSLQIASSIIDIHVEECLMKDVKTAETEGDNKNLGSVSCLACGKNILKSELNTHLDECMVDIFDTPLEDNIEATTSDQSNSLKQFNCPFCLKLVTESGMKEHIDDCLQAERDTLECFNDDY